MDSTSMHMSFLHWLHVVHFYSRLLGCVEVCSQRRKWWPPHALTGWIRAIDGSGSRLCGTRCPGYLLRKWAEPHCTLRLWLWPLVKNGMIWAKHLVIVYVSLAYHNIYNMYSIYYWICFTNFVLHGGLNWHNLDMVHYMLFCVPWHPWSFIIHHSSSQNEKILQKKFPSPLHHAPMPWLTGLWTKSWPQNLPSGNLT